MPDGPHAIVAGLCSPCGKTVVPRWIAACGAKRLQPSTTPLCTSPPDARRLRGCAGSGVESHDIFALFHGAVDSGTMGGEQRSDLREPVEVDSE